MFKILDKTGDPTTGKARAGAKKFTKKKYLCALKFMRPSGSGSDFSCAVDSTPPRPDAARSLLLSSAHPRLQIHGVFFEPLLDRVVAPLRMASSASSQSVPAMLAGFKSRSCLAQAIALTISGQLPPSRRWRRLFPVAFARETRYG